MKKQVLFVLLFSLLILSGLMPVLAQDVDPETLIAQLPDELAMLYDGILDTVLPSAYDGFEMPAPPWKFCHAESFMGNPWRVAFNNAYRFWVDRYIEEGLISDFLFADANLDVALQISQIRNFIDQGCDVITTIAASSTGLDAVISDVYEAGIPFITIASAVTSPYAINIGLNPYVWGRDMGNYICETLGNSGNILFVEGIAGQPIVALETGGGMEGLSNCPGVNIVAQVNGNWSPVDTKNVVLQALATNPVPIAAVWTSGSETAVIAQVFRDAGLELPLITGSISGDAVGFWKENDDFRFFGGAVTPDWHGQIVFRVAVRMLLGQEPLLNRIVVPLPQITIDDFPAWARDCMTVETPTIFPIPPEDVISEALLNEYFRNGEAIPFYDYSLAPDPCDAVSG